jgi:hypothetical protein
MLPSVLQRTAFKAAAAMSTAAKTSGPVEQSIAK